ncbi:efflux transporter outer membrane subunit [Pasteurella testudinis]|uniref:efflux transporter outer membrane subunit n=1 Tax=Pasteurella testudinis TaxID=761 RepID=UPI00405A0D7F
MQTHYWVLTALSLYLTACSSTQVALDSKIDLPTQYQQTAAAQGSQQISRWWQQWRDPQLSALIERGLQQNFDLAMAQSRLQEARAISALAGAELAPQVGASGTLGGQRTEIDNNLSPTARQLLGSDLSAKGHAVLGGVAASWEPDIFGQKRSDADAAKYAELGAQERVYGTQMLVASEIADHYLRAQSVLQQQQILNRTLTTLQQLQRYIGGRFEAGQVNAYEVNEINAKIDALKAQQAGLPAQFEAYQRSIAVLIGQVPQGFKLDIKQMQQANLLQRLPQPPQGQQPGSLLAQRPDIRANAAAVQAYAAKLASAKADLLPRFDIQFLWQTGRIELDGDLPALKGWGGLGSVGVQLPIFTAGRIDANIQAADARLQTALLQYDQSILQALAEVDSSYQAQFALTNQLRWLSNAQQKAARQAQDSEKLFRYGDKTLDVALRARLDALDYQQNLLKVRLAAGQNLLNLYKAIGGGWQAEASSQ